MKRSLLTGLALAGAASLLVAAAAERPRASASPAGATGLANTQAVYAAFTVNLTRFITWPEGAFAQKDAPLVIGTFPRDPINEFLDEGVKFETVDGHPLRTMRIQSLDDLARCHVVFISKSNARPAVLARVVRKAVLTVSDADGFLDLGGHVRFESQPPRIKLRISPDNLKTSGLESRAQLLRLAAAP